MVALIILILVVLGLAWGSFINALVWRLRMQEELTAKDSKPKTKKGSKLSKKDLSILHGRSMCPQCHHALRAVDLLPLVSWLALRGKCRYCKAPISWQYPLVEVTLTVLYVVSYLLWPFTFDAHGLFLFGVWLVALIGLLALLVYDMRWMILPNAIVFPLTGLALVQVLVVAFVFDGGLGSLLFALYSLLIAGGIFYAIFVLSRERWIGGGDVKLGFALGLLLGSPWLALLLLFTASLLGTLVSLPGLLTNKLSRTSRIPFGPFLIVATVIVMLFGRQLVDWYINFILQL